MTHLSFYFLGNTQDGVHLAGNYNTVLRNRVGVTDTDADAPNGQNGISVMGSHNIIAGENVVGSNTMHGIYVKGSYSTIYGNLVGLDTSDGSHGNGLEGIKVDNAANTDIRDNVVCANGQNGIYLFGNQTVNTIVEENFVGVPKNGLCGSLGNNASGITVDGVLQQVIRFNKIGDNRVDGILVVTSYSNVSISGNLVGVTYLGVTCGNHRNGITNQGGIYQIGGNTPAERNIVSGNLNYGIYLAVNGSIVTGNYIGTNPNGTAAVPNVISGIYIEGSNNIIGGSGPLCQNLISGNGVHGIDIAGTNNQVERNCIGTDYTGELPLGNGADGVHVSGPANRIGDASGLGNLISANGASGVALIGSWSTVFNNSIGLTMSGALVAGMGNQIGVFVNGSNNQVGSSAGGSNLITNSLNQGVLVSSGNDNTVVHNTIGLGRVSDVQPNLEGVQVGSTAQNTLVGSNVISGNTNNGAILSGVNTQFLSNIVGLTGDGTTAAGNGQSGVVVVSGAINVYIGNTTADRNLISNNTANGVWVQNGTSVLITYNWIGLNSLGNAAGNNNGIRVSGGNPVTIVHNVVSGNTGTGIIVENSYNSTTINLNYVGTDTSGWSARPNLVGISLESTAVFIPVWNNVVSGNVREGIVVKGSQNSIWSNMIGTTFEGSTVFIHACFQGKIHPWTTPDS